MHGYSLPAISEDGFDGDHDGLKPRRYLLEVPLGLQNGTTSNSQEYV